MQEEAISKKDILEIIYKAQSENLDEIIIKIRKELEKKIKPLNKEEIIEELKEKENIEKTLEKIEDNYSIKISEYNKAMYKQGFKDGINIILECLK